MKQQELFETYKVGGTPDTKSSAVLSDCQKYRYFLSRIWDDNLPKVLFIMLNPSTADANNDDPTIRRCKGFADFWGYGGFYVVNLFAFRSPEPKDLLKEVDPIGPQNEMWFHIASDLANYKPLAWLDSQKPLHYLELSKDGTPKHPLYLPKELIPKRYVMPNPVNV